MILDAVHPSPPSSFLPLHPMQQTQPPAAIHFLHSIYTKRQTTFSCVIHFRGCFCLHCTDAAYEFVQHASQCIRTSLSLLGSTISQLVKFRRSGIACVLWGHMCVSGVNVQAFRSDLAAAARHYQTRISRRRLCMPHWFSFCGAYRYIRGLDRFSTSR